MDRILTTETIDQIDKEVKLAGWVHRTRRLGKLVFIDLRDRSGLMQIIFNADIKDAKILRPEYVIEVEGKVVKRQEKNINKDNPTGWVEVQAQSLKIFSAAVTPPFEIVNEERQAGEDLRLKYRYLDLRHERMAKNIKLRHRVIHFIRNYLTDKDFTEIQTPILTKSTPEGARDYLVPSRVHPGKFFALPQSPQQYKQLLMVAGFEKYFQIAPCFRDEDARADRSPGEFYQLDLEMSFVTQEDILKLAEELFASLAKKLTPDKKITTTSWPRLTYQESMEKYGTDSPDLRQDKNDPNELAFAWILDFPLFTEQTKEDYFHGAGDKWAPSHHMFTAPKPEDIHLLDKDPGKIKSLQHDLVLNGHELGGGSIRIHDPAIQNKIFELIGFNEKQKGSFQHLLEAFKYGVPPHGGIAPGIDRLVAILVGEKNIREVIAFPLNSEVRDPMMDTPAEVDPKQLDELGLLIKKKP
ncbi:MAG: aspartate--tRNA ligase [Patescibacteria group bacterium]